MTSNGHLSSAFSTVFAFKYLFRKYIIKYIQYIYLKRIKNLGVIRKGVESGEAEYGF
jgi:hypothetical protein